MPPLAHRPPLPGPPALPAWAAGLRLSRLADLEEAGEEGARRFATGHDPLDRALGGGFAAGSVAELSGPPGSLGLTRLLLGLLLSARQAACFVALIDGADRFAPVECPAALREALLWVRAREVRQALKAADLLAHDPNFGLLLLDLREAEGRALRRVPAQQWYRLQRAVREQGPPLIAFTPYPCVPSAATRVQFHPGGPLRWEVLRSVHHEARAPRAAAV